MWAPKCIRKPCVSAVAKGREVVLTSFESSVSFVYFLLIFIAMFFS